MEAKYKEITLGETICERLKDIYFKDEKWSECHKHVAVKFSELKKLAHAFYVDKDRIGVLMELNKYTNQDLQDVFG